MLEHVRCCEKRVVFRGALCSLAPPLFTHGQREKKEEEEEEEQDDRADSFKAPSNHGFGLQPATQTHVTEEYGLVSLFEHLVDNHDNPRERERERWR